MKKIVVVLGVSPEYESVYREQLNGHKVHFTRNKEEALGVVISADVFVVHVDKHGDIINMIIDRGFVGKFVVITTSTKIMKKLYELPTGKKLDPVCFRTAPQAIMRALATHT